MKYFFTYRSNSLCGDELENTISNVCNNLKWNRSSGQSESMIYNIGVSMESFGETIQFKVVNNNININIESNVRISIADSGKGFKLFELFILEFQKFDG